MPETIQDLKAIVDDAPDNSWSVSKSSNYYDEHSCALNSKGEWSFSNGPPSKPRALSDIKQIIAQAERIAELEDLRKMILDAESADASLIPFMYQTWLHKAKQAEAL